MHVLYIEFDFLLTIRQPAQNGVLTDFVCRAILLCLLVNPAYGHVYEYYLVR